MTRKQLNKEQRTLIYKKYNKKCAYCGCDIEYKDMHIDHVEPIHNGGVDEISNLTPACRSCNHYKSTYDLETFRQQLGLIPIRLSGKSHIIFGIAERYGLVKKTDEKVKFYFERVKLDE